MQNSLALEAAAKPPFPEQEQNLPCPRCDSTNTKFCYYNNYNLSQPRHFCKSCRRYWTKGGALRNIPVGGGTRKNSKRPNNSSASSASASNSKRPNSSKPPKSETVSAFFPPLDRDSYSLDVTGSFSALLASEAHFDNFLGGGGGDAVLLPNSSIRAQGMELLTSVGDASTPTAPLVQSFDRLEGDPGCWDAGWTDLAIYNPGSSMH